MHVIKLKIFVFCNKLKIKQQAIIKYKGQMFDSQYTIAEVIKSKKSKKTSIVTDQNGKYFIAKRIPIDNAQGQNQIQTLRNINHPNIVSLHDLIIQKQFLYLIEEYCEQGDLAYHMLRRSKFRKKHFTQQTVIKWISQMLMALEYLHERKIVHRDLRPQNIFLTAQGNIKIGSFKFSKILQKQSGVKQGLTYSVINSPYYSAPQCIQNSGYSQKVDIWALGCIIQQLCSLESNNIIQSVQRTMTGKVEIPQIYSQQLTNLCQDCLKTNSKQRPNAHELLSRPYLLAHIKNLIAKQIKTSQTQEQPFKRKIPIKRYNIHKQKQQSKKVQQFKKLHEQRKQSIGTNYLLKKSSIDVVRQKLKMGTSKQDVPYSIKIKAVQQNARQVQRKSSAQSKKQRQKLPEIKQPLIRAKSRQITKRSSISKYENQKQDKKDILFPNIQDENIRSPNSKSSNNSQNDSSLKAIDSPPKKSLPPPRPPRRKSFNAANSQLKNNPSLGPIQNTKTPKKQQKNMSKSELYEQAQKFEQSIKTSVNKIFDNLLTVKGQKDQNYDEQLSFDLSDDQQIRLTSAKANQEQVIADAYKTKLQQLIKWMNCKYSPDMETILQRTMEMDSNTFQKLRGLQ